MSDDRTLPPSEKRKREAVQRGEVWQSRELGTAAAILSAIVALGSAGPSMVAACEHVLRTGLTVSPDRPLKVLSMLRPLAAPLGTILGIVLVATLVPALLTGLRWSGAAVTPKPSRLRPLAGLKRIVGPQGLVELGKALFKTALLGTVGWWALRAPLAAAASPLAAAASPLAAAGRLGEALMHLLDGLAAALVVVAALDVPWQRSRWLAKLRMTRQEAKDEARESDGNPETRAAQRRLARAAARAAIAPAMAEATVVTINPSEFAVALRYVPGRDAAPVIVARGRDIIAAAIRELAAERRVPVLRYPQLTRAIFFTGRIGQPIRDDLYGPVAAVLAYVFAVDAAAPLPQVSVPAAASFDEFGRPA